MMIYESMPNSEYHSHKDHISSSFVKSVAKHSVAKALQPLEPSQALMFGDAMHTYFEDQEAYNQRFKVFDDADIIAEILERRPDISAPTMTKDYKTYKKKFEDSLEEGQSVIGGEDHHRIEQMFKSATENKALQNIYGQYDHVATWDEYSFLTDEEDMYGLKYRVRPDRLLVGEGEQPLAVIDWKSCRDASAKAFRSDFWKYRYDLQAVFYCEVLGVPADNFYFVAIEKEFPYNSAVYSLSEDTIMNTAMALGEVKSRISQWKKEESQASLGLPNANTITLL